MSLGSRNSIRPRCSCTLLLLLNFLTWVPILSSRFPFAQVTRWRSHRHLSSPSALTSNVNDVASPIPTTIQNPWSIPVISKQQGSLFIQQSPDDPDTLWLQIRPKDSRNDTTCTDRIASTEDDPVATTATFRVRTSSVVPGECSIEPITLPPTLSNWMPVQGILGYYPLASGSLWVFLNASEAVYAAPPLQQHDLLSWWQIRKVSQVSWVHLTNPALTKDATPWLVRQERRQRRLLQQAWNDHVFYFSHGSVDMTQNLQASVMAHADNHTTTDTRFVWNQMAMDPIARQCQENMQQQQHHDLHHATGWILLQSHLLPITSAFVGIQTNVSLSNATTDVSNITYDHLLISRRNRFRAGTRFTRRGADGTGAVANFVETEVCTLIHQNNTLRHALSHVQIRGSIPLRWSSPADVQAYRPRVLMGVDPLAQARAVRRHLVDLSEHYVLPTAQKVQQQTDESTLSQRKLVFVNLIDKKKDQGRLGRAMDQVLKAVMDVPWTTSNSSIVQQTFVETFLSNPRSIQHVWFDFHAELKSNRWDRLAGLLQELEPTLDEQGFFWAQPTTAASQHVGGDVPDTMILHKMQSSVIRTNCMDCLDRTNVVQSMLGRYVLVRQLLQVSSKWKEMQNEMPKDSNYTELFQADPLSIPWIAGETSHRTLWADNADEISRLYAGTRALKGDFTRTGQRTKKGAMDDGLNSLQRYYLNNFQDADRQEGIDLMVGHIPFTMEDSESSSVPPECVDSIDGTMDFPNLSWLPREMQLQIRQGLALLMGGESDRRIDNTGEKLQDMRQRLLSHQPWWCPEYTATPKKRGVSAMGKEQLSTSTRMLREEDREGSPLRSLELVAWTLLALRAPESVAKYVLAILCLVWFPDILIL